MSAGDTAKLMFERKIKRLPVVENGRLVCLVTLTDLVRSQDVLFPKRALYKGCTQADEESG